jgi:SAM-dependent methyltransferase
MSELHLARVAVARSAGVESHLYDEVLDRFRALAANGAVLDFGTGRGLLARRLLDVGEFDRVVAVDLVDHRSMSDGIEFQVADATDPLPLPDETVRRDRGNGLSRRSSVAETPRALAQAILPASSIPGCSPSSPPDREARDVAAILLWTMAWPMVRRHRRVLRAAAAI